jgi:hypothetical protein
MRDVGQPFLAAGPLSSGSSRLKVGRQACGAWFAKSYPGQETRSLSEKYS